MFSQIDTAVSVIVKLLRGVPFYKEETVNRAYYIPVQPSDNGINSEIIELFELKLREKLIKCFLDSQGSVTSKRIEIGPGDRMDTCVRDAARKVDVPIDKLNAMKPCTIWINPTSVLIKDLELKLVQCYGSIV